MELPEGFEIVTKPDIKPASSLVGTKPVSNLPEGFEVVTQPETQQLQAPEINPEIANITDEQLMDYTQSSRPLSDTEKLRLKQQMLNEQKANKEEEEATNIISKYNNMYSKYSTGIKSMSWDADTRNTAQYDSSVLKNKLLKELNNQGIQDIYINKEGKFARQVNGVEEEIDSSMLQDMWSAKFEVGGAVTGSLTGARVGAIAGPVGALAGGLVGGATGAFTGKGLDIAINQFDIIQKIDSDLALQQMKEAGIVDAVGTVAGHGVIKGLSFAGTKVKNLYNYIYSNNIDGAYDYALKHFNVTEQEAKELVQKVQSVVGPIEGTDKEQVLKTLATTQAGGEAVIKAADIFDPTASSTIANQVFDRAKQLKAASNELSTDNIHYIVNKGLDDYINNVQTYYANVKQAGSDFTKGYTFDFEQTGLKPILDDIGSKIEDPRVAQGYANLLSRVEDATEGRTFEDLIDLRQLVNEVKYNSGTITKSNKDKLNNILTNIDSEITRAADTYIPQSKQWLDSWDKAKLSYSEMKQTEQNVLFKALTKPGITNTNVVSAVSKYIGATTDNLTGINVFNQVMEKLPKNVRSRVDGAIIDNMVEKYSAGTFGGNRAVNFPLLASKLQEISWKNSSSEVQQLTRTINKMSEVFKNDVNLARVSGKIEIPKFQSYLTADPVIRLKYEVASSIFNKIKQLVPGDKANALSLLENTAKLLENPLSSKTVKDLYSKLPKDRRMFREKLNFDSLRNDLANEYIQRQQKLAEIQGTNNLVPRLVWKQPLEAPTTQLSTDATLYGTQRGTVSTSATKAIMNDRSEDLIAEFVQNSIIKSGINERLGIQSAEGVYDKFVGRVHEYLSDKRLMDIGTNVRKKLIVDDNIANQRMIAKTIEAEANTIIKRIEKDFGVKMPQAEADKLVRMKFKELMEECNEVR